jgi:uncharacterized protein (DUF433 family)
MLCWQHIVERIVADDRQVDWSKCPLVESVPGKVSGVPILKGTRMPVQTIVDNYDYGMLPAEIAEAWEIELSDVQAILEHREKKVARST